MRDCAPMAPGDTARLYHRLTSYAPDRAWTTPADDSRGLHDFVDPLGQIILASSSPSDSEDVSRRPGLV
jgi:hypothetical protein